MIENKKLRTCLPSKVVNNMKGVELIESFLNNDRLKKKVQSIVYVVQF